MYLVLFILLFSINIAFCAKILTICPIPSYSHQAVYSEIWKELALRDHQVVSVTTHPVHNASLSNLREIDVSFLIDIWTKQRGVKTENNLLKEYDILLKTTEELFHIKEIQELKNDTFDLVIVEWVLPVFFGYSAYFKAPLIGIMSMQIFNNLYYDMGNPVHPIVYPECFLPFNTASNFWERFTSMRTSLWLRHVFYTHVYPKSNNMVKTYIDSNLPTVEEISKNTSMLFINSNLILNKPRQILPNIIQFSGLHLKKPRPLPQDIKYFLDNATQGAIYFSLGSYIKSNMLTKKFMAVILETFHELPYKVLWKFDETNITASNKILISKWLPQSNILAHKNIKVFITQGGLQSIEEAVTNRVPMIGIPFIMDQSNNIRTLQNLGISNSIDKSTITKKHFKKAITEIAENPVYRQRIKEVANIFEDQPLDNKENIIWWIEYVLRHKGAPHLRSPFVHIPWYQLLCLDILAFLVLALVVIILIVIYLFKIVMEITTINFTKKIPLKYHKVS